AFTPHLVPMRRGILSTLYVPLKAGADLGAAYASFFPDEPFVALLGERKFPEVRDVRGTNNCQIGWTVLEEASTAIVVTAIDNLGKGGSGQAVQNLNVRFGLDERDGLRQVAAVP